MGGGKRERAFDCEEMNDLGCRLQENAATAEWGLSSYLPNRERGIRIRKGKDLYCLVQGDHRPRAVMLVEPGRGTGKT